VPITVNAFLTAALVEIKVARVGDVVNPNVMDYALTVFNELLDALNLDERAIYSHSLATVGNLTPALQPHTIGVAANAPTFTVTIARPSSIIAANLVLANSIRSPITIRDDEWWMNLRAPAITSAIPTDLNYRADWPNGALYLWPIPTTAYGLELETDTLLAQMALIDPLDLPPGYQQALRLTVAELLAPGLGQTVSESLALKARDARARVWGNNEVIPLVNTCDGGMPGLSQGGGFDYRTGFSVNR
jgi:hypothetical protein